MTRIHFAMLICVRLMKPLRFMRAKSTQCRELRFSSVFTMICVVILYLMIHGIASVVASNGWELGPPCLEILKKSYSSRPKIRENAQIDAENLASKLQPVLESYKTSSDGAERTTLTKFDHVCALRVLALVEGSKERAENKLKAIAEDAHYPLLCRLMGWKYCFYDQQEQLSKEFLTALETPTLIKKKPKNAAPFWQDQTVEGISLNVPLTEVIQIHCDILEFWGQQSLILSPTQTQHIFNLSNKATELLLDPGYGMQDRFELGCRLYQTGCDIELIKSLISRMVLEIGLNFKRLQSQELTQYCKDLRKRDQEIIYLRHDTIDEEWVSGLVKHWDARSAIEIRNDAQTRLEKLGGNTLFHCFTLWMLEDWFNEDWYKEDKFKGCKEESREKIIEYLRSDIKDRYQLLIKFWGHLPGFFEDSNKFLEQYSQFFCLPYLRISENATRRISEFSQMMWECLESVIDQDGLGQTAKTVRDILAKLTPPKADEPMQSEDLTILNRVIDYLARVYTWSKTSTSFKIEHAEILDSCKQDYQGVIPLDYEIQIRERAIKLINDNPDKACESLKSKKTHDIQETSLKKMYDSYCRANKSIKGEDLQPLITWAVETVAPLGVNPKYSLKDCMERWHALKQAGCEEKFILQLMDQTVSMIQHKFNTLKPEELLEYCERLRKENKEFINFRDAINTDYIKDLDLIFCKKLALVIKNDLLNRLQTFDANTLTHNFGLWMLDELFGNKEFQGLKKESIQRMKQYFSARPDGWVKQLQLLLYEVPVFLNNSEHLLIHYPPFSYFHSSIYVKDKQRLKKIENEFLQELLKSLFESGPISEEDWKSSLQLAQKIPKDDYSNLPKTCVELLKKNRKRIVHRAYWYIVSVGADLQIPKSVREKVLEILSRDKSYIINVFDKQLSLDEAIKVRSSAITIINQHLQESAKYLQSKKREEIQWISVLGMIISYKQLESWKLTNKTQSIISWAVDNVAPLAVNWEYSLKDCLERWYALKQAGLDEAFIFELMKKTVGIIQSNFETLTPPDRLSKYCERLRKEYSELIDFRDAINTDSIKALNREFNKKCALVIRDDLLNRFKTFDKNTPIYCFSLWMLEELLSFKEFEGMKQKSAQKVKDYLNSNLKDRYKQFILLYCRLPVLLKRPKHLTELYPKIFFYPYHINEKDKSNCTEVQIKFGVAMGKSLRSSRLSEAPLLNSLEFAMNIVQGGINPFEGLKESEKEEVPSRAVEYVELIATISTLSAKVRIEAAMRLKGHEDQTALEVAKEVFKAESETSYGFPRSLEALAPKYKAALIIVALEKNEAEKQAASDFITRMEKKIEKKRKDEEKRRNAEIQQGVSKLFDDL